MANTTNLFSAYIKWWLKNFKTSIKTLKDKKIIKRVKNSLRFLTQNQPLIKESPASLPFSWQGGNIDPQQGAAHRLLDSIPVYYSSLFVGLKGLGHNGFSFILSAHISPQESTQPCHNRWPWKLVQIFQVQTTSPWSLIWQQPTQNSSSMWEAQCLGSSSGVTASCYSSG